MKRLRYRGDLTKELMRTVLGGPKSYYLVTDAEYNGSQTHVTLVAIPESEVYRIYMNAGMLQLRPGRRFW